MSNSQKPFIPNYVKGRKEGMHREEQIKNKWNDSFSDNQKKKYNVKQRPDFFGEEDKSETTKEMDDFLSSIEVPESFSTNAPDSLVQKNTQPEAKRQPNSGAMWHAKGDISLEHALMEVKERGTVNGRGEKTISIDKKWLDKQEEEALLQGKEYWYLAFAYKGSEDVYIIKPYDDEIEMVSYIRRLQKENDILREVNKQLGQVDSSNHS